MKALSKFISYALITLMGFVIVTFFSTVIYGYYNRVIETNVKASLKQVAIQTANGIIYLYDLAKESNASPKNSSSIVISDMSLNLPTKVSGKNYEIELVSSPGIWSLITNITIDGRNATIRKETGSGAKIIAKTIQRPFLSYEYELPNIPIHLQGKFKSGRNDTLRLVRYNYNDSVNDMIVLGESEIIIGITSIT